MKLKTGMCSIIGLSLLSTSVFADQVATILVAVSKVVAKQAGQERVLQRGSSVNAGEVIVTQSNGSAQLKYSNGTLVSLGANTEYETVKYTPGDTNQQIQGKLNYGSVEYTSTGKEKGSLQTPVVALAILGTQFVAQSTAQKTFVTVKAGLIQGGATFIGPGQQFSSGVFGEDQKFTPGGQPLFPDFMSSSRTDMQSQGGDTSSTITATTSLVTNTTVTSTISTEGVIATNVVPLSIICPP